MNLYADQGVGNKLKVGGGSTSETSTIFSIFKELDKKRLFTHARTTYILKIKSFY